MAYSALDISKLIISLENDAGRGVTNLRLQKLLYFVQANYLCDNDGKPCFNDRMEAWPFGPVIPSVYEIYKENGSSLLPKEYCVLTITDNETNTIKSVLELMKNKRTCDLVNISHRQLPWINAIKKGVKSEITPKSIYEYFKNL